MERAYPGSCQLQKIHIFQTCVCSSFNLVYRPKSLVVDRTYYLPQTLAKQSVRPDSKQSHTWPLSELLNWPHIFVLQVMHIIIRQAVSCRGITLSLVITRLYHYNSRGCITATPMICKSLENIPTNAVTPAHQQLCRSCKENEMNAQSIQTDENFDIYLTYWSTSRLLNHITVKWDSTTGPLLVEE